MEMKFINMAFKPIPTWPRYKFVVRLERYANYSLQSNELSHRLVSRSKGNWLKPWCLSLALLAILAAVLFHDSWKMVSKYECCLGELLLD